MTSMTHPEVSRPARTISARDLFALSKPRASMLVLITAMGGLALAPVTPPVAVQVAALLGIGLLVAAANALNMYLERDVDGLMSRTRNRPLPAGRLEPAVALWFGVVLGLLAALVLTFAVNALTGMLGVIALLSYVYCYTPLKQLTPAAVWVGAVPGAMPVLLGWTAATNGLELGGLGLFALMFMWQLPHFHAIAMFRTEEYARAGLKTLPGVHGPDRARRSILALLVVQVAVSIALAPLGIAGNLYLVVAIVLGAAYVAYAVSGYVSHAGAAWARRFFFASILYLPLLFAVLVINGSY